MRDWEPVLAPADKDKYLPVTKPSWEFMPEHSSKMKATWLSHASFLVELPAPLNAKRGARVLFDPVFSDYCADGLARFASWGKTMRRTAAPCCVDDLEGVDVVLISHNHFDHMDTATLKDIQNNGRPPPHFVVPLNNEEELHGLGQNVQIHSLDWWQSRMVTVNLPPSDPLSNITIPMAFEITCVPSQHQSNRSLLDRNKGLWGGFVVSNLAPETKDSLSEAQANAISAMDDVGPFSCFFAGDTGYGYVAQEGAEPEEVCPAFKEMGQRFNGFDLALLPIGAYDPRPFMSGIHSSPEDSVNIFRDVRARRALAMHWGTFTLTNEPFLAPMRRLAEACKTKGLAPGAFSVCGLGETVIVDCNTGPV